MSQAVPLRLVLRHVWLHQSEQMTNIEGQLLRSAAYAVIYSLQLLIVVVIICIPYLSLNHIMKFALVYTHG